MTLKYCKAEFILENIGFFFWIALKIVLIGITFRNLGVNFISLPYQNIALMQIHFIPKYLLIIMHILTLIYKSRPDYIVKCPAEWRERKHDFCRELIVLPGACVWSLDTYFKLTYCQFITCMFYSLKFHTTQDFLFKYHSLHLYSQC